MSEKPLISIIIPAYNIESYIKQTLDSVLCQDYTNIEIIVIDDGSKDKTLEVCETIALKDKRIKIIHQDNQGVSTARNNGICNANGKYITFVDGDDIVADNLISKMLQVIENYNVDLVCSDYSRYINDLSNINNTVPIIFNKYDALKRLAYNESINYSVWGKLYKTEIVKNVLFDKNTGILEDFLFVCNYITRIDSLAVINDKLYCYVVRNGSALNNKFSPKRLELIYSYDESLEIIKKKNSNLIPYYRCSYLSDLISLKGIIIQNKSWKYLSIVDERINKLKKCFLKGSKKKRFLIMLYKVNPYLYYKLTGFYMGIKAYISSKIMRSK